MVMLTVDSIKELRAADFTEKQADAIARIIEQRTQEQAKISQELDKKLAHLESKDPATKGDVRESELKLLKEIEILKKDTFKFVVYTGIGVCMYLTGAMYTFIKFIH